MIITGPMCRAARALVEVSRERLSGASKVEAAVIEEFERKISAPKDSDIEELQAALEELGAVFIPERGADGAGVRLKFSQTVSKRVAALENEGGPVASDDIP